MFEAAASAAATLAQASTATVPALLGVSIPAPLPLAARGVAANALLSVVLDAASGRLTVQSQAAAGAAARLHLAASAGIALAVSTPAAAAAPSVSGSFAGRLAAALRLPVFSQQSSGTAMAGVQQGGHGQSGQYNVHPAVLDCCTQVRVI